MIGPSKIVYQEQTDQEQQINQGVQSQGKQDQNQQTQQKSFFQLGIPVDAFASLKGHQKTVSCVEVDPKGVRLATGGLDYTVRLWDFHGMNTSLNSFRIIQPFPGNPIRKLCFNRSGSHLMVVCGGKQIAMLDKDGAKSLLTVKGYMYIKQLHKTKGHTNTIYDACFHPINSNEFATGSGDGTIRMWDLDQKLEGIEKELAHKILLKCKDQKTLLTGVTGLSYTMDGKMLFGGCMDGSLQGFSTKHNLHRPQLLIREAHRPHEQYTSILSFEDSQKIVTRNTDHTLKVWDLRMFNKPYVHYSNLPNCFPGSKMCWSPDKSLLVVGTSIGRQQDEKQGYLHFFDSVTFNKLKTINMGENSVSGVTWSPAINQIVVGTSQPEARVFFDARLSKKGAMQCIVKKPRVDRDPTFDYSAPIYLPHSLPMYKQRPTNNIKKDIQQMRKNPQLSAKPFVPIQGPNKGGKQLVAYTQIQHMIQSLNANLQKVEDARKPLWQIAKHIRPSEYTKAYQLTQPKPIYNDAPTQTKQFQFLQQIQKICPHCGLKLCTCARMHIMDSDDDQQDEFQGKVKEWK